MGALYRILVVEDDPQIRNYLLTTLKRDNFHVESAPSGPEALERIGNEPVPDLVLLEALMMGLSGLEVLKRLRETQPSLRVVMVSGICHPRMVMEALRLGAMDYLSAPIQKSELESALKRVLDDHTRSGNGPMPAFHAEDLGDDATLVFASSAMRKVREQAAMIASADVPVLLLGESGTGKGVIAQLIHKLSHRARGTFLKVNCAALPSELLESELFGYEPGAFTGATKSKPGKFEMADKGTILLDEIGDLPIGLQAKLLHVLQDQEFFRLGGRSSLRVNVRVMAATNLEIEEAVACGKIRPDLYYRLNAFTIHLPPLRERPEEIPILMKHFMGQFAAQFAREPRLLSNNLLRSACEYPWPGNLRELENFVKRYLIIGDEDEALGELQLERTEASRQTAAFLSASSREPTDLKSLVSDAKGGAEVRAISDTLDQTNWNRKEAARRLNISYKALLNKIQKYGLDRDPEQPGRAEHLYY
jgi:two-component system response regulator AtoC